MDKELVSERRLAFGQELKKAREARGVSLPGLAQETRIRLDFVEALESGDFAKLPGEVFGRGFVRSIGRTLGVDPHSLIGFFDAAWGPSEAPQSVLKVEIKNKPTRDPGEHFRVQWANTVSILRRGLGVRTVLPLAGVLIVIGLGGFGLVRGGTYLVTQIKQFASRSTPTSDREVGKSAESRSIHPAQASGQEPDIDTRSNLGLTLNGGTAGGPATVAALAPDADVVNAATPKSSIEPVDSSKPTLAPGGGSFGGSQGLGHAGLDIPSQKVQDGQQVLELVVSEPVRIRLDTDQQPSVTKELLPDTYRFTFGSKADLMVYDAAALKVLFNGKSLGSLGSKGRIRRLSFQAESLKADKKL
jgi:cytoskeletal protein RodZ